MKEKKSPPGRNRFIFIGLIYLIMIIVIFNYFSSVASTAKKISVQEFEAMATSGQVERVTLRGNEMTWTIVKKDNGEKIDYYYYSPSIEADVRLLKDNGVIIYPLSTEAPWYAGVLGYGLIFLVFIIVWVFVLRRMQGGGLGQVGTHTKHNARSGMSKKVTFADMAGAEEAKYELMEVVNFLKDPSSFMALGAKIPKGVLLVGLPGTGKTLLARATAGEAEVSFLSISGSEFVEMFVGVGAGRVRNLFKEAREKSPCIIFIDEIDAVGRARGAGVGQTHDESGQTLNQILAEMDGFEANDGIIVLAATNRPDVLDPALLRPGRFDRQVTVPKPDVVGREAILKVHTKDKVLKKGVNLKEIARMVPDFVGAQLEQLANEAAILAARKKKKAIEMSDFEAARDKVLMGPERNIVVSEEGKRITAYHEAGHALVGIMTPGGDPIHMVTIVPRGQAMGVTTFLPKDDREFISKDWLVAKIMTALGGRLAEEIIFGPDKITVGAGQDLKVVTNVARRMVCDWAMSGNLPLRTFGERNDLVFLGRELGRDRDYSEDLARRIDDAVQKIVNDCTERARNILEENIDKLHEIANTLLDKKTLTQDEVMRIAGDNSCVSSSIEPEAGASPLAFQSAPKASGQRQLKSIVDRGGALLRSIWYKFKEIFLRLWPHK